MNRQQVTQYNADHVAVLAGAEMPQQRLPATGMCEVCGGDVSLDSIIAVTQIDADGSELSIQMTEAEARILLGTLGLPQPPIMCDQHEETPEIKVNLDA